MSLQVKERHEKRLAILQQKSTQEFEEEISKIKQVLSTLKIEESIKKATALELKYSEAISKLDSLDKVIILDGYINGKAYWKIGRDIGYTEVGVQKRIKKIFEKLAILL